MANHSESNTSKVNESASSLSSAWLKLGAVAAASALVGGVAAAWWYRKTLAKLRQDDEIAQNPHFGIPPVDPSEES